MNFNQPNNTCLFNTLYVQYVEDIGRNEFFYYDLKYPVFYNVKNGYFQVNDSVLQNLNDTINSSVYTFKQGILEEEQQIKKSACILKKKSGKCLAELALTVSPGAVSINTLTWLKLLLPEFHSLLKQILINTELIYTPSGLPKGFLFIYSAYNKETDSYGSFTHFLVIR